MYVYYFKADEGDNVSIKSEDVSMNDGEPEVPPQEQQQQPPAEQTPSGEEGVESEKSKGGKRFAEDDVPWGSLASFALYKLFSEWQSQGYQLPATASPSAPPVFQKVNFLLIPCGWFNSPPICHHLIVCPNVCMFLTKLGINCITT